MKPPPPRPVECEFTISTQQWVDTMASAAVPPFLKISTPILEQSSLSAATAHSSNSIGLAYSRLGCFPDAWTRFWPTRFVKHINHSSNVQSFFSAASWVQTYIGPSTITHGTGYLGRPTSVMRKTKNFFWINDTSFRIKNWSPWIISRNCSI